MGVTRRLAAVVVADVAGYSRLMERDETGTHERLRAVFRDVVDPKVAQHVGRIVKTTGDGMLLEFASATSALRFAVEMQRDMAARNAGVDAQDRIEFRIGINIGDIIVDGDDIAGDGVNVAARLEPIADPGGICVSGAVREHVRDHMGIEFDDLGDRQVKNIAKPIRVFRVLEQGTAGPRRPSSPRGRVARAAVVAVVVAAVAIAVWRLRPHEGVSEPPARSVFVQPFAAQDEDSEVAALARGLGADVSRALANSMRDGSVVDAPQPSVRYRLAANVRAAGGDVVIAASLVDALSGKQLAAEERRIQRARIAQDRDLLVARLTGAARQMIEGAETRRLAAGPDSDARALVARAASMSSGGLDGARAARKVYRQAIDRDPSLVSAWLGHLYTLDAEHWYDFAGGRNDAVIAEMERDSLRALELDNRDARVWLARQVALESQWQWEPALEANARAGALDPSRFTEPILLLILAGRPEEALERIAKRNARIGKDDPSLLFAACNALLSLGRYEEALRNCERATAEGADYWSYLNLVAAYAHTGDLARATAAKDRLMRSVPDFTISRLVAKRFSDSPAWERSLQTHFIPAWRKAGVPE